MKGVDEAVQRSRQSGGKQSGWEEKTGRGKARCECKSKVLKIRRAENAYLKNGLRYFNAKGKQNRLFEVYKSDSGRKRCDGLSEAELQATGLKMLYCQTVNI